MSRAEDRAEALAMVARSIARGALDATKPAPTCVSRATPKAAPDAYRGWAISYSAARPVTGQWRAERFGVGMCAGTRDALIRMIDTRADEVQS